MLFETKRLLIRTLKITDSDPFFDMMGNPNVMNPIPLEAMSKTESDLTLKKLIALKKNATKKIWSLIEKENSNFIGICGLLKNNEDEPEIAYRLREQYWGKGYGTETAKGLINFGFETLNFNIITADVNIVNTKSVKILEKFFDKDHEFFNKRDNCTDRRYKLTKENWVKRQENNTNFNNI